MRIDKAQAGAAGVNDPELSNTASNADLYLYAHERDSGLGQPTYDDDLLVELFAGPVMTPTVGRNLLGDRWYDLFVSGRNPNDLMLGIMSIGPYSIDGEKQFSSGPFKRLRLLQNGKSFPLSKDNYRYLGFLHGADKPKFAEMGLFWIDADSGIDPVRPWALELTVESQAGEPAAAFRLDYALADEFILMPTGLGAAMAIGGKLRMVNLLKRRAECGTPCQLCARRCPINAIEPSGKIKMDECFYCLDCQVLYHDQHVCPPLVSAGRRPKMAPLAGAAVPGSAAGG